MNIAISGISGFIGMHLAEYLTQRRHLVFSIGRGFLQEDSFPHLVDILSDCDAVINLAGAPINRRWTLRYKQKLRESRIGVTSHLVCALKSARRKPKAMLSVSAVGYYPSQGSYDERDEVVGEGFLASICREWEAEAKKCPPDVRLVITRLGVVLAPDGGALPQMVSPLLHTKLSAVIGTGRQPFPWVSIQDVCRGIAFLLEHKEAQGVYNLVSPQQISQRHLARALAVAYHAWALIPLPRWAFHLLMGEMSDTLLSGQSVSPSRLLEAGYDFSVPTIEALLQIQHG